MNRKNKGFTLIELLVSLSIITIVLMTFFTIRISSIKSNVKNEKDIKSMNIAQSEIENIRLQIKSGSNQFKSINGLYIELNGETTYDKRVIENSSKKNSDLYNIEMNLKQSENEDGTKYENLYNIEVKVFPLDKMYSKKEVTLTTEISGKIID